MEGNTNEGLTGGKGDVGESVSAEEAAVQQGADGGGWGGWGFSPLSYLSDLQKVAAVAAEEISRNAAAVAKSLTDVERLPEDNESSEEKEEDVTEGEVADETDKLRKSALDKLEQASEESLLSQGLKAIDNSVENFTFGAWQALGSALKGGSGFIQKLEQNAANLADSVHHGGSAAYKTPSLLETGRAFTAKGMQVLENVGKETMELLISETGIECEKKSDEAEGADEDQLEEMTFDRCFYIYGGPEQLEDLEALSSHYALLYNRKKAKLASEQKSFYEGKLKEVQQILDLNSEMDASASEPNKGKKIETRPERIDSELKSLHDASVNKAADMAAGFPARHSPPFEEIPPGMFTSPLVGLAANDIIQRTAGRLESIHSEGVHKLSEICCFATSQLLMLGKSIIANANKTQEEMNVEWPEDCIEKAKIVRTKAQSMAGSLESVSNSFITGISDVVEAYLAAIKGTTADSDKAPPTNLFQEKASALSERLRSDQISAVSKIQDGTQYLSFVVLSASVPSA